MIFCPGQSIDEGTIFPFHFGKCEGGRGEHPSSLLVLINMKVMKITCQFLYGNNTQETTLVVQISTRGL